MKLLIALLAISAYGESICGKRFSTPDTAIIEISCFKDLDITQVRIIAKYGAAVEAILGIQYRLGKIIQVFDGSSRAIIDFYGVDHQELPTVNVLMRKE